MRIALVSSEYPPFRGGGIGTYTETLSDCLATLGHEVHVITNAWPGEARGPAPRGLTVHRIAALTGDYRPVCSSDTGRIEQLGHEWSTALLWSTAAADRLAALHASHRFDVVEFPECFGEAYVAIQRARAGALLSDLPMTVTLHSPMAEIAAHNAFVRRDVWVRRVEEMENASIVGADGITCPSRNLLALVIRRLGEKTFASKPVAVIPNPLDPWWWQTDTLGRAPQRPCVLYVGRLEPRKGVPLLVDAAVSLLQHDHDFDVQFMGSDCDAGVAEGSMRDYLERRIPARLRGHFRFERSCPRGQLREAYTSAMACVFPAPWDNFPYTCAEAMACGAAVVGTSNSGMAEMLGDGAGVVIPPADLEALMNAIARLAGDAGLRRELGQTARRRIASLCAPTAVAAARLEHYHAVIAAHNLRRAIDTKGDSKVHSTHRSIAVLLRGVRGGDDAASTRQALEEAARLAESSLQVDVCADTAAANLETTRAAEAAWLERIRQDRPTYLFTIEAGEWLAPDYFVRALYPLEKSAKVAWATTWCEPEDPHAYGPYCGWDFCLPLDLTDYRPIPFALMRRDAFEEAGGWNLELPFGWRQWDLYLSLAGKGWHGIVVPVWAARHRGGAALELLPPSLRNAHELLLEAIAARNRELFERHGPELWLAHQLGSVSPPTSARHHREAPRDEGPRPGTVLFDFLRELSRAHIVAPANHVAEASFFANYPYGAMLMAHPPSKLTFDLAIAEGAVLRVSMAMHPAVYDKGGGAVRFVVRVAGKTMLDDVVDAKRRPEHRGWKDVWLPLQPSGGKTVTIEFITRAVPEDEPEYCTAGWGVPQLIQAADRLAAVPSSFRADWLA